MRDFPVFTTDFGVSSLILREIPYKKEAYIRLLDVQPDGLAEHLEECIQFCRIAGAERVYAAGSGLNNYPKGAAVLEMHGISCPDPEQAACLFPVTEATVSLWREIYNKSMANVDNAGTLEKRDEKQLLESTGVFFIHENKTLLGIGWIEDHRLLAVAATKKGMGRRVMHTLLSACPGDDLLLEVASTNERAIHLYETLGFLKTRLLTQWHIVFPNL